MDAEIMEGAMGAGGDGEVDAMSRLRVQNVIAAVDRLTPDQRSVLLLRVLADLPIADIAEIVGKGEPAVKALLRRAVATMGRQMGDTLGGDT